jgi:hypothetical protein
MSPNDYNAVDKFIDYEYKLPRDPKIWQRGRKNSPHKN